MELVALVREVGRRRLLAVVLVLIAALAATWTAYKLPSMEKRSIAVGAATGQILVDSSPSTLIAGAGTDQIAALGSRARVYAQYLSSRDAVNQVSAATGIPSRLITARGPFSEGTGVQNYQQQPAESRAKDLTDEGKTYRLVFQAQQDVPIITVYSTGPTAGAALKLAQSSFDTLQRYVAQLKQKGGADKAGAKLVAPPATSGSGAGAAAQLGPSDVVVRELGAPEGGLVGGSADLAMMVMAFIAALGVQILLVAIVLRFREQSRLQREAESLSEAELEATGDDEPNSAEWETPEQQGETAPERRWRATYARG